MTAEALDITPEERRQLIKRLAPELRAIDAAGIEGDEREHLIAEVKTGILEDIRNPPPEPDPEEQAKAAFSRGVSERAKQLRIYDAASRLIKAERNGHSTSLPAPRTLTDFQAEVDDGPIWRVQDLWSAGGNVMIEAQYKAGKSVLIWNLIRSLVDGDPFLGAYDTNTVDGPGHSTSKQQAGGTCTVLLIDNELDERSLRRGLKKQGIVNTDNVELLSLRGQLSGFDILDPETRTRTARSIEGCDVVIFDCLRPVLDALGLDENREAGRFLTAWDELLKQAWISESVIVHHMGHNGERSRGDSRLKDWPDQAWKIVREDDDPSSPRYFSAFGRDSVNVAESRLQFDPDTLHLTITGGSRKDAAGEEIIPALLDLLNRHPQGLSQNKIEQALGGDGHGRKEIRSALKLASAQGHTVVVKGAAGKANIHKTTPTSPTSPDLAGRTGNHLANLVNRRGCEGEVKPPIPTARSHCRSCGDPLHPVSQADGIHPSCPEPA